MIEQGFPPVVGAAPRVLVLGSMPGRRSLDEQRYYAHPQNRFWPLMAEVAGFPAGLEYEQRLARLAGCGVALWDVLAACERPGSLDTAIVRHTEVANPIAALLASHPTIRAVACNGAKSHLLFRRHVLPTLGPDARQRVEVLALPSTSPANASIPLAVKREAWGALRRWLDG